MKIATILGARPQFIKSGPVSRALAGFHDEIVVHTGQHYDDDMSDVFFRELGLQRPSYELGVGSGPHGQQTGRMLEEIEGVLLTEQPDLALVYGDTNSTLAGALAASKLRIPIAHVEAGLRSFNRSMPEEINRVVTDHLARVLFCPTESAARQLAAEGVTSDVFVVGDVMKDALDYWASRVDELRDVLAELGLEPRQYYLATVHRAENVDDPDRLRTIVAALRSLDMPVIFPVHPRTGAALARANERPSGGALRPLSPLGYLEMIQLERDARVILTDSGGVQKEAYLLGVPCVTLRDESEWRETIESGWNTLAGANARRITSAVRSSTVPGSRPDIFGDGLASSHICRILTTLFS